MNCFDVYFSKTPFSHGYSFRATFVRVYINTEGGSACGFTEVYVCFQTPQGQCLLV